MDMLRHRYVQESRQNQPSVGSHSSLALLYAGASSDTVAAFSSLELYFLAGKAKITGGLGVGEDGASGSGSGQGKKLCYI
jgi:hypothetical protein